MNSLLEPVVDSWEDLCQDCCESDLTICEGHDWWSSPCSTAGKYVPTDSEASGFTAWAKTPATTADKETACCKDKSKCGAGTQCSTQTTLGVALIKQKDSVTDTFCDGDAQSCLSGTCCEYDTTKCGGNHDTLSRRRRGDWTFSCPTGKVNPACQVEGAISWNPCYSASWYATWLGKATTSANAATDCCVDPTLCSASGYSCPAGTKKKAVLTAECAQCTMVSETTGPRCTNGRIDVEGCATVSGFPATGNCCEPDTAVCGGITGQTCSTGKYSIAATTAVGTAATASDYDTTCCATKATCASTSYSCPAGKKKDTSISTTECTGDATTCPSTCCIYDPLKCGGIDGVVCVSPKYNPYMKGCCGSEDNAKIIAARDKQFNLDCTESNKNDVCCSYTKATCTEFKAKVAASALVSGSGQLRPGVAIVLMLLTVLVGESCEVSKRAGWF